MPIGLGDEGRKYSMRTFREFAQEDDGKLEALAALEHDQWAHWTKYMLDHLTPENIIRWKKQIDTPYEDLSEKEKDSDREWARKAMKILHQE